MALLLVGALATHRRAGDGLKHAAPAVVALAISLAYLAVSPNPLTACYIVRGHRLLRQWAARGDVRSLYEVELSTPVGWGSVVMSDWHVITGGKLQSGRVLFDTATFGPLVSGLAGGERRLTISQRRITPDQRGPAPTSVWSRDLKAPP